MQEAETKVAMGTTPAEAPWSGWAPPEGTRKPP